MNTAPSIRRIGPYAVMTALFGFFCFFLLLPVYTVVREGLRLPLLREIFTNFLYREGLLNSLAIAGVTTFLVFAHNVETDTNKTAVIKKSIIEAGRTANTGAFSDDGLLAVHVIFVTLRDRPYYRRLSSIFTVIKIEPITIGLGVVSKACFNLF